MVMDYNNFLNLIKLNLLYKKKIIKCKINKKNINLIKSLITLNIIKYIKYSKNNNNIFIYINNNWYKYNSLKKLYKTSQKIFIKNKIIKKLTFKKKWIFLLSTNKGIITNFEAIKKNLGGIILIKIDNG